jgi:cellulose synthase operon protein C
MSNQLRWVWGIGLGAIATIPITFYPLSAQAQAANPITTDQLAPAVPSMASPAIQQGYQLLEQGWVDAARDQFIESLQTQPDSVDALLGLAIAYRRLGQDSEAFTIYQRVARLDPNNRSALLAIGLLGGFRPDWQPSGIVALNQLLVLEPSNTLAKAQRALLLFYQGRLAEAIRDYDALLSDPAVAMTLRDSDIAGAAQVYAYSGRAADSIALFERYSASGTRLTTDEVVAYAYALRQTGALDDAIALLSARLNDPGESSQPNFGESGPVILTPAQIELRSALAIAYTLQGNPEAARPLLDPLRVQLSNPSDDQRGTAYLPLARALHTLAQATGDPAAANEAIALYKAGLANPSLTVGIARETADVLSAYPSEDAYTVALYQQLSAQYPDDLSLFVQRSVWERQLNLITDASFSDQFTPDTINRILQLPSNSPQRPIIQQALIRLDPPVVSLLPLYEGLATQVPETSLLQFRLAQVYVLLDQREAARTVLERYSQHATQSPSDGTQLASTLLLAELDRKDGNLDASSERYQSLIAQARANGNIAIESAALQGLAGIRFEQRHYHQARRLYDQALALDPSNLALNQASISLTAAQGRPLAAIADIAALQATLQAEGQSSPALAQQRYALEEGFLLQRGFSLPWERY